MDKQQPTQINFWRASLPTLALTALMLPAVAIAQSNAQDDEIDDSVEEIVVTGSNIRGTPIDSPSSIQILKREDLEAQGSPTLTEIVRSLGISSGNLGETNQFQANAAEGVSTINIRGLGSERSLVLLNGRRLSYVGYGFGNAINLNSLPSIAIERLEVLKEGAATTYGSDAVAGVANVLTRSKFTGLEANVNLGMIAGSGGDTQIGIIWGTEYSPGNNVVVSFGLQTRSELPVSERSDWAYVPATSAAGQGWSGIGNPGTFVTPAALTDGDSPLHPTDFGSGDAFADPACGESRLAIWSANQGVCRFRYTVFDNLIEDESHNQIFVDWTHSFSDTSKLHVDFLMHDSEVPEWKTSPSYPPQALFGGVQYVFPDHPGYVDIQDQAPDLSWSGATGGVFFGRIVGAAGPSEVGERQLNTTRINAVYDFKVSDYDMHVGLTQGNSEGYLLARDASIHRTGLAFRGLGGGGASCPVTVNAAGEAVTTRDISADIGNGNTESLDAGTVLYTHVTSPSVGPLLTAVLTALSPLTPPVSGPNGTAELADFRNIENNSPDLNCLYYNPFSNAIPQSSNYNADVRNEAALLDWMVQDLETTRTTSLLQLDYTIQGELTELGGGQAGFAAGVHIRQNTFELDPTDITDLSINPCPNPGATDCAAPTGLFSFLSGAQPLDVDQNVTALFFEAALPFQDNLDVQAAIRYEDYGDFNSIDPKVSLRWEFIEGLTLRSAFGTTFRGPVPSQSDTGSRITVLAFIAPTGAFKAVDIIGNDQLEPEAATNTNLGIVWTPDDRLELVADYWSFDFTGPIVNENQDQLVAAYSAGGASQAAVNNQIFCTDGLCNGDPISGVQRIESNFVNGADVSTSGLDLSARYTYDVGAGSLLFGGTINSVMAYDVSAYVKNGTIIADAYDALGFLNQSNPSPPLPSTRMRLWLDYGINNHSVLFYLNDIGSYEDQRDSVTGDRKTIAAHQTFDVHYHYEFSGGNGTISGSMLNLADADPPIAALDLGYDPFTHSAFGTIIKVGVRYKFF